MDKDKECLYKDRATAITSAMRQEVVNRHNAMGGTGGIDEEGQGQIPGACDDRLKR